MFWIRSSDCCELKNCCTSTSTLLSNSRSESYYSFESTSEDDEDLLNETPSGQHSDEGQCPCSFRSFNIPRKEQTTLQKSKHRLQIKIIDKHKPKKSQDQKLIHYKMSRPHIMSVVSNSTEKAISSNGMSQKLNTTRTPELVNKTTISKTELNIEGIDVEQKDDDIITTEKISKITRSNIKFYQYTEEVDEKEQKDDSIQTGTITEHSNIEEYYQSNDEIEQEEQKDDNLTTKTISEVTPSYIEHFYQYNEGFGEEEQKYDDTKKETISEENHSNIEEYYLFNDKVEKGDQKDDNLTTKTISGLTPSNIEKFYQYNEGFGEEEQKDDNMKKETISEENHSNIEEYYLFNDKVEKNEQKDDNVTTTKISELTPPNIKFYQYTEEVDEEEPKDGNMKTKRISDETHSHIEVIKTTNVNETEDEQLYIEPIEEKQEDDETITTEKISEVTRSNDKFYQYTEEVEEEERRDDNKTTEKNSEEIHSNIEEYYQFDDEEEEAEQKDDNVGTRIFSEETHSIIDENDELNDEVEEEEQHKENLKTEKNSQDTHSNIIKYDQYDNEVEKEKLSDHNVTTKTIFVEKHFNIAENDRYNHKVDSAPALQEIKAEEKDKQIIALVEKFKSEALSADDILFEKLIRRLKNELDLLSCACAEENINFRNSSSKYLNEENVYEEDEDNVEDHTEISRVSEIESEITRDNDACIKEMRDMFAELKCLLEGKFSENKVNEEKTDERMIKTCPGDINGECDCKNKISHENSIIEQKSDIIKENNVDQNTDNLAQFYEKIATKIDEIVCQCLKENIIFPNDHKNSSHSQNYSNKNDPSHTLDSLQMKYSQENIATENLHKIEDEKLPKKETREKRSLPRDNDTVFIGKKEAVVIHTEKSEGFIALDQFMNLANELKEAFHTSSCKCTKQQTETRKSEGEKSTEAITSSDKILPISRKGVLQDSLKEIKISETPTSSHPASPEAVESPQKSNLFEKIISLLPLPTLADTPTDSFYSAQCDVLQQQSWQQTNFMEKNIDEEIEVNTTCKCHVDKIVQTFEDTKISFGVFCDGQLPVEEPTQHDISNIEVRRKITQEGDVEKILVRIRLKEDEVDDNTEEKQQSGIETEKMEQPKDIVQSFADYEIKYEAIQKYIDEPKVVKVGNQIKIFIPLG